MASISITMGGNKIVRHGDKIDVVGGHLLIDGVPVSFGDSTKHVVIEKLEVSGFVQSLTTASGDVVINGEVGDVRTASGDVQCGNVKGNVSTASGDVDCGDVEGSINSLSGRIKQSK